MRLQLIYCFPLFPEAIVAVLLPSIETVSSGIVKKIASLRSKQPIILMISPSSIIHSRKCQFPWRMATKIEYRETKKRVHQGMFSRGGTIVDSGTWRLLLYKPSKWMHVLVAIIVIFLSITFLCIWRNHICIRWSRIGSRSQMGLRKA